MNNNFDQFIKKLQNSIENIETTIEAQNFGIVRQVGDGIALIEGLNKANIGSMVVFFPNDETAAYGMVISIEQNYTNVMLFNRILDIKEGVEVFIKSNRMEIPCSEKLISKVVNPLCVALDGSAEIVAEEYRSIEANAPGIMERVSVFEPLQTGIKIIDALVPIGLGQKELILGDRQTGKTTIAIDTILNQKKLRDKGEKIVYCIYVAIGQKASTIAKIHNMLKENDAMQYTTIFATYASDPVSLQYIAPMAATSFAEFLRDKGYDVLVIFDDLTKHANAYREISLLMKRTPSRGAYPGDIFYLHSRLLERAVKMKIKGSITMLPIIETQAGDVSDYIPTNVISITDGQIYLDKQIFFKGQKPAINIGLSVSRIGSAAQFKAMKQIAGKLKGELALFEEVEEFSKSVSDLDEVTVKMIKRGRLLLQLFQQKAYSPKTFESMIISLLGAVKGTFDNIEIKCSTDEFEEKIIEYFNNHNKDALIELNKEKALSDNLEKNILKTLIDFKDYYVQNY